MLQQIAYDAAIEDLDERLASYAQLSHSNPIRSYDHEGFGLKLTPSGNQVLIAKDTNESKRLAQGFMANDSAVFSPISNGVLEYFTTVFNNKLIKQILQTTPSTLMTESWQQGMFGTTDVFVPTISYAGGSKQYDDLSGAGESSVNIAWVPRQTVTLQRTIAYGDLTQAQMAMAKIPYVEQMREGLASLTNLDINAINFKGFAGLNVFGLLNDPSLNPTIVSPDSIGTPSSSLWYYKTYDEIIHDIQSMFNSIIQISGGQASYDDVECILGLPPACMVSLTKQNSLGTMTVRGYLDQVFPKMKIVQVQNYQGTGSPIGSSTPNYAQLIFKQLNGQDVAYNVFSTLWNSHGVVRLISSYAEKISYVVSGSFLALPLGVATISGI